MSNFKSVKNKLLTACACVSTVFFFGFVSLFVYALIADPRTQIVKSSTYFPHISFSDNFNVTAIKDWDGNWNGSVVFFNQEEPFIGGGSFPQTVSEEGWIGWGIYFRLLRDTVTKATWWTLMISFWYPITIFGILPIVFLCRKWRRARKVSSAIPH